MGMRGDGGGDDVVVERGIVVIWAEAAQGRNGIDARRGCGVMLTREQWAQVLPAVLGVTQLLLAEAEHAILHFGGGQVGCALADIGRERHRGFAVQANATWPGVCEERCDVYALDVV